ncbi:DNA replication licensing factor mcm2, partial [Striga asiatica]
MASNGDKLPGSGAGAANENPASAALSSDQLPMNSSQIYTDDDGEASVEAEIITDEEKDNIDDEEGEDLFNDQFMNDFRRMGKQDQYETLGLDDSVEDDRVLDQIMADSRAAEIELDAKQPSPSHRKYPQILHDQDTNDDEDRLPIITRGSPGRSKGRNFRDVSMTDMDDGEENEKGELDMYRVQGTLSEWVTRDDVRRFIAKKFKDFLLTYANPRFDHGDFEYLRQINEMVAVNKCSLEIDYRQIFYTHPNIAIWLVDAPQSVLEVMEEVANKIVFQFHPNYSKIHQKIFVRITNVPVLHKAQKSLILGLKVAYILDSRNFKSGSSFAVWFSLIVAQLIFFFSSSLNYTVSYISLTVLADFTCALSNFLIGVWVSHFHFTSNGCKSNIPPLYLFLDASCSPVQLFLQWLKHELGYHGGAVPEDFHYSVMFSSSAAFCDLLLLFCIPFLFQLYASTKGGLWWVTRNEHQLQKIRLLNGALILVVVVICLEVRVVFHSFGRYIHVPPPLNYLLVSIKMIGGASDARAYALGMVSDAFSSLVFTALAIIVSTAGAIVVGFPIL